jgi:drug/metabolite transporter (DMT)-like permease
MEKVHPLAIPTLILAAIFGGLASIFGKLALRYLDPYFIIALRFALSLIILFPFFILQKGNKFAKKDSVLVLLIGLLGAINVFCFIIGLQYTTSIMSQVLYLFVPVVVLLLSKLLLGEKFSCSQILGIALGILGTSAILERSFVNHSSNILSSLGSFRGNVILLAGVFAWSLYLILSKKASQRYSPLALTVYANLVISVISIVLIANNLNQNIVALGNLKIDGFIGILGLALINSVAMIFLFQWGTKHASAFAAASVTYLGPVVTAVIAIPLFNEKITPALLVSSSLIFLGLYLSVIYPLVAKKRE